jgi:general secretion pathway protein A
MYTTFYNLREEPFRLTSDPRFFHLAEPHAAALATLVEAVMRRKGFVLMTGPIGTGKTTVVHAALQILTERAATNHPISSAFILNPTLSREEFLEMLLSEFEITCTSTSKPARLAALQRMLLETQRKGGTSLLLVDEAHLLTAELLEEIRLLSNADTYQEKLLQIVLCGQPELLGLLRKPELRALRQRVASSCVLRPLSLPEVRSYIAERLHSAGFRGTASPFPAHVLEEIVRLTEGVPRLLNLLCDASLTIGYKAHRPVIDLAIVAEAATELGLNEIYVEHEIELKSALAGNGTGGKDVAGDAVIGSALDLLFQAM